MSIVWVSQEEFLRMAAEGEIPPPSPELLRMVADRVARAAGAADFPTLRVRF